MYNNERNSTNLSEGHKLPESEYTFEVKIENDVRQVYRQIQKALTTYKDEKRGKDRMPNEYEDVCCLKQDGHHLTMMPMSMLFFVIFYILKSFFHDSSY